MKQWFQNGGSQDHANGLKEILLDLMPELGDSEFHHKPCVTTYTKTGYPFIDELSSDNLYTACAGCGLSAKSSNELGSIAARRVIGKKKTALNNPKLDPLKLFQLPDSLKNLSESNNIPKAINSAEA